MLQHDALLADATGCVGDARDPSPAAARRGAEKSRIKLGKMYRAESRSAVQHTVGWASRPLAKLESFPEKKGSRMAWSCKLGHRDRLIVEPPWLEINAHCRERYRLSRDPLARR